MDYAKNRDRGVIMVGMMVTIVSLAGAFALGDYTLPPEEKPPEDEDLVVASRVIVLDGNVAEGATESEGLAFEEKKVVEVLFVLTWEDEPDADARHTNTPDTLELEVTSDVGSDSTSDSSGRVTITFTASEDKPWDLRDQTWGVNITALDCGDQKPLIPDPGGFRTIADGGNSYQLEVEIKYQIKEKTE